jgi:hypothetical protein
VPLVRWCGGTAFSRLPQPDKQGDCYHQHKHNGEKYPDNGFCCTDDRYQKDTIFRDRLVVMLEIS